MCGFFFQYLSYGFSYTSKIEARNKKHFIRGTFDQTLKIFILK